MISGVSLATVGGRGSVVGNPVVALGVEWGMGRLVVGGAGPGNKGIDLGSLYKHVCFYENTDSLLKMNEALLRYSPTLSHCFSIIYT